MSDSESMTLWKTVGMMLLFVVFVVATGFILGAEWTLLNVSEDIVVAVE